MHELELLREKIDSTDERIIALLQERMTLSAAVARFKMRRGMEIYAPEREKQLMERVDAIAGDALSGYITAIYDVILAQSREYQRDRMKNLILIGMPGCGKTTVGKAAAEMLGRDFYDTDSLIEEKAGCGIPEIFASSGEEAFRELEHEALRGLSGVRASVIATGGGTVLRADNRELIRKNSVTVWLRRDLVALSCDGRPVSQSVPLEELYERRAPLYAASADIVVENDCESPAATAEKLIGTVHI